MSSFLQALGSFVLICVGVAVLMLVVFGVFVWLRIRQFKETMRTITDALARPPVPTEVDFDSAPPGAFDDEPAALAGSREFQDAGFAEAGRFSIRQLDGAKVIILTHASGTLAVVTVRPGVGILFDVISLYANGSVVGHRNLPGAATYPPGHDYTVIDRATPSALVKQHLSKRRAEGLRKIEPHSAADELRSLLRREGQWRNANLTRQFGLDTESP